MEVPPSLRAWFLVHAAVDVAVALPLLAAPVAVLHRLGWTTVDPVATRLVAAALLAIGGQSFLRRDAGVEATRALVGLNVIWSLAGAGALFVGVGGDAPPAAWALLCVFIVFAGVWIHHAIRFRQHDRSPPQTPESPEDPGAPEADEAPAS
jgi:hypothetical protein